ncbi:quinon protein alcohol dehydrogenase-like superfamily [Dichotomopilus funicola]|uniref:Quinon protein alcohol dehydrogenase-like superfamily n=1 Tax=Dichotomopilus funicola TaxID=1934379 RepID=A0AAN6V7W2_9PEZI|nr:quinon protein alcohol dehydrogenase-like superfamily [Dichotomopilus funicola]
MASTPSNRIKLTPSASPFLTRPSRSPIRPRALYDSSLSLQRVVGTTCASPTGFDTVQSSFAYIAGGAVVVVDVSGEHYAQRFYRARPSAVPLLAVSPATNASSSTPIATPKANDSRNRTAASPRESLYAPSSEWPAESPSSKTWTSRERIKAATCLALSRDGRYLAVGETGYAPRVLLFNLQDASSDVPLVSISEHTFGVRAVAWSPDTRYLASLGAANDGFLYLWKVDPRTGAVKLFQQNKCTSSVRGMVWMGTSVITFGVRHAKVWRVFDDEPEPSPGTAAGGTAAKSKTTDATAPAPTIQTQKPLPGRNILLGSMLDATFSCTLPLSDEKAVICSETGCVCLVDDTNKQIKLTKVLEVDFSITCVSRRGEAVYVGGKEGQFATIGLNDILNSNPDPTVHGSTRTSGLIAMGFLAENFVTIDSRRSIDIWSADNVSNKLGDVEDQSHIALPGLGDPIVGIQRLCAPNGMGTGFFTWSGAGRVTTWNLDGMVQSVIDIPLEQPPDAGTESNPTNQVVVAKATDDGSLFVAGDKLGVLRVVEASSGECLLETKAHSSNCQDISVYEGKTRFLVASCGRDRTVQLFHRSSAGAFEHFQTLEFSAKVVQVLIPTEDKLLTCSLDRTLQVHELVSREGDPDVMAAIPFKVISLKASPSSMVVTAEEKAIFVSLLDRSVCQFDFPSGRMLSSFKCNDEAGQDAVVLESLTHGQVGPDLPFLLGISNTDKSVRVYDAQAGCFVDREWGHTEAINGVVLVDNEETGRRIVSVGEDGTIMIWTLEVQEPANDSRSRDPSPEKLPQPTSARPPLRRVLSKAELAEFQRPSSSAGLTPNGSSGRHVNRRPSKFQLPFSSLRTPNSSNGIINTPEKPSTSPISATSTIVIDDTHAQTPSRRPSSGGGSRCSDDSPPPASPKTRNKMSRRPSLPALGATPSSLVKSRKNSSNHRSSTNGTTNGSGSNNGSNGGSGGYGFGTLSMATEQTCRQLRAYRKKLASADTIHADVLAQLDAELRLTAAALGERAIRSRMASGHGAGLGGGNGSGRRERDRDRDNRSRHGSNSGASGANGGTNASNNSNGVGPEVSETLLSGLLDQYSERLVSMLDEKLRMRLRDEERDRDRDRERDRYRDPDRPTTAGQDSCAESGFEDGDGESCISDGTVCEEPEEV